MSERDPDELARALAGLAAGEHIEPADDESDHTPPPAQDRKRPAPSAPPIPPQSSVKSPRPAPPRMPAQPGGPMTPRITPVSGNRPGVPQTPRPTAPAGAPRPTAPPRPTGPERPSVPSLGQIPAPRQRVLHVPAAPAPVQEESAPADDDVLLAVPPPPPEELALLPQVERHRPRLPSMQSISVRQTVVPILLTIGLGLIVAGVMKFLVSEDSPMHDLPGWLPVCLIAVGLVLIGVAAINMLQIRSVLRQHRDALSR